MEKADQLNTLYYSDGNNNDQIVALLNDSEFTAALKLSECVKRQNLLVVSDETLQNVNKIEEAMENTRYLGDSSTSSQQSKSISIQDQSPTSVFNLAVMHFQNHNYPVAMACISAVLDVHGASLKFGLSVKLQYLYLECLFRQFQLGSQLEAVRFKAQFQSAYSQLQKTLRRLEEQQSSSDNAMKLAKSILSNILKYRSNIYLARHQVLLGLLTAANKTLDDAIDSYGAELNSIPEKALSPLLTECREYHPILCYLGILPLLRRGLTVQLTRLHQLALNMKANIECQWSHLRSSIHLLEFAAKASAQCTVSSIHFNNMGCTFMKMNRLNLSVLFFQKALTSLISLPTKPETTKAVKGNGSTEDGPQNGKIDEKCTTLGSYRGGLGQSYSWTIVYNAGCALLKYGDCVEALACFSKLTQLYEERPHLYLRMGECFLHKYVLLKDLETVRQKKQQNCVLRGAAATDDDSAQSFRSESIALLLQAEEQFTRALKLLSTQAEKLQVAEGDGNGEIDDAKLFARASKEQLEASINLKLSYVQLCLGRPQDAWRFARCVLEAAKLPNSVKISDHQLAKVYIAEALFQLDNLESSQECLHQVIVTEQTPVLGSQPYLDGCVLPADWSAILSSQVMGSPGDHSVQPSQQFQSMIRRSDQLLSAAMSQPTLIANQAVLACHAGQLAVGQEVLQRLLAAHQGFGPAIRALIGVYFRAGKRDEALALATTYTTVTESS